VKVLVTGASGLLGAHVAQALHRRGDEVTVLQRRPSGLPCREVLADVADPAAVTAAASRQDAVVHLAAKVGITGQWADFARVNVEGTGNVVAACFSAGVGRLVHISSPSVAHAGQSLVGAGASAAEPASARGHYARSKAIAERIALSADGVALSVVAIRPHLVWGPGDTQLVGRLVARARAGRLPVVGSGAALVDSTYISNAADAIVAAVDRCQHAHSQALVVSNGEPRPVGELIAAICQSSGAPAPTRHIPCGLARVAGAAVDVLWAVRAYLPGPLPGDPPLTRFLAEQLSTAHWFDQRHTRQVLGWAPAVSIDQGLVALAAHRTARHT